MEYALLQAVFLPLLLSPVAYILGRKLGHSAAMWFTFGLLLYCTVLVITSSLQGGYEERYPWTELFGEFGFVLDGLASPFAILIYVMSTILVVYSKPYMTHKFHEQYSKMSGTHSNASSEGSNTIVVDSAGEKYANSQSGTYYALFLVFAMGMLGTILSTNLIEFYIFFSSRINNDRIRSLRGCVGVCAAHLGVLFVEFVRHVWF